MTNWQALPWTNELGKATHTIKRTGCKVMVYAKEGSLLHCLTGNEASVFVEANELEEIK
tara:strand:- start:331 stop:507 length:177 start_codon:yes stop_codon:yes gene_type:complete